jgi:hypothetical protein
MQGLIPLMYCGSRCGQISAELAYYGRVPLGPEAPFRAGFGMLSSIVQVALPASSDGSDHSCFSGVKSEILWKGETVIPAPQV